MHISISSYLSSLADKGRSPLTIKAARGDLVGFATWWEARLSRPFDPALLRPHDLHTWRLSRQKDDAAVPATINRALVTLRAYCDWAKHEGLSMENPVEEIKAIPTSQPVPKSLPAEAVDAILRAVRGEKDERIRLRTDSSTQKAQHFSCTRVNGLALGWARSCGHSVASIRCSSRRRGTYPSTAWGLLTLVSRGRTMSIIHCEAKLFEINSWIILRLPESASAKLPSRGMTMVSGTINGAPFKAVLEPDGRYAPGQAPSHWFRPDKKLLDDAHAEAGDSVHVSLEPTNEWIEPDVPEDLRRALATSSKAEAVWNAITPLARWDWIRWIRAVKTPETRQKHIDVALDKLNKGMRRPCCFNRNLCSEPEVSHNWVLLDPKQATEKH